MEEETSRTAPSLLWTHGRAEFIDLITHYRPGMLSQYKVSKRMSLTGETQVILRTLKKNPDESNKRPTRQLWSEREKYNIARLRKEKGKPKKCRYITIPKPW
jgi:hypothetical protein